MIDRNITWLAETVKGEIDRMCVTDRLSEVDTMALHAHENIRILQRLRYKQLVNNSQGVSQAEQTENSSEIPNNCETCKYGEDKHRYAHICNECGVGINNYESKDGPQTEQKWTCARCGCENHADFIWCFKCGYHKEHTERSE